MHGMQAQWGLTGLAEGMAGLPALFPNLKYVVTSGTVASFAGEAAPRVGAVASFGFPPDVILSVGWANGFSAPLVARASFDNVVAAAARLDWDPVRPEGELCGNTTRCRCVNRNVRPAFRVGYVVSGPPNLNPGAPVAPEATARCKYGNCGNGSADKCFVGNFGRLAQTDPTASVVLDSVYRLGTMPTLPTGRPFNKTPFVPADAPAVHALETDDYYVAAALHPGNGY